MKTNYDIFISYRRDGGFETAKHLNDLLVHDGYTVSFDIDTLREGDFDETLLRRIDQCVDFILVVDKHTFDRTLDPEFDKKKDWLRTELAYALKLKKNIIPVLLSGVNGFPTNLPEDVADVATKNGPEYNKYYFDEFYKRLKSFLHCVPRNAKVEDKDYATITLYSDSDASVSSDGEHLVNIKAKEFTKAQVPLGEHVLEYVSMHNSSLHYSEVHAFNEVKNYVIQIKLGKKVTINSSLLFKIILGMIIAATIFFGGYNTIKPEGGRTKVRMEQDDGVYKVPITVNGLLLRFILDAGSSSISLSLAEVKVMLRQGQITQEDILGMENYQDAAGNISTGAKVRLRSVDIGGIVLHDVEATIVDNIEAPLLLGLNVLNKFGKVTIDYSNNVIEFY